MSIAPYNSHFIIRGVTLPLSKISVALQENHPLVTYQWPLRHHFVFFRGYTPLALSFRPVIRTSIRSTINTYTNNIGWWVGGELLPAQHDKPGGWWVVSCCQLSMTNRVVGNGRFGHWPLRALTASGIDRFGHYSFVPKQSSFSSHVWDRFGDWPLRAFTASGMDRFGHRPLRALTASGIDRFGHWPLRTLFFRSKAKLFFITRLGPLRRLTASGIYCFGHGPLRA